MSFSLNLPQSQESITEIFTETDPNTVRIDNEIEQANKEIQEYISLYSLLQREIAENRKNHEMELSKIREEIERTKDIISEQTEIQKQSQILEEQQYREVSGKVLEHVYQSKNNIEFVEQPKLTSELKQIAQNEETIKLEEELHKLQLEEVRDQCTFIPEEKNPTKEDYRYIQNEVEKLQKSLTESRDHNKNVLSSLEIAHKNEQLNHKESIDKLKRAYEIREKEQQKHLDLARKLLVSEKQYSENETAALERQQNTLKEVREKLKQECSRRVKEAIAEMKKASEALDNAEKSEESNQTFLDSKSSMTLHDNISVDKLRTTEILLKQELDKILKTNQSAVRYLQDYQRDSEEDILEGFGSQVF